jgi:ribosome maturation factor RimP
VVSDVLDSPEGVAVMGDQPYVLEVGSPGTDRPLTLPKHWRRAKGRLVRALLHDGGDLTGRILDADEDGVLLEAEVPGKKKGQASTAQERRLEFSEIAKARVEIEFNRKDAEPEGAEGSEDTEDFEGTEDEDLEDEDIDEDEEG